MSLAPPGSERIEFQHPHEAGWFLRRLRDNHIEYEDSCILENLFIGKRIELSTESAFLKAADGTVLSLALINSERPAVHAYYTIPDYRGRKFGFRLLIACIERIIECGPNAPIYIEPISEESEQHIRDLPQHLKERLMIIRR